MSIQMNKYTYQSFLFIYGVGKCVMLNSYFTYQPKTYNFLKATSYEQYYIVSHYCLERVAYGGNPHRESGIALGSVAGVPPVEELNQDSPLIQGISVQQRPRSFAKSSTPFKINALNSLQQTRLPSL